MFLTVPEAAERARCHPQTIFTAARSGKLHGFQRVRRGTWKFEAQCVDAWVREEKCAHKAKKLAV